MVSRLTTPDRPSEHSSQRSPARASRTDTSGTISMSKSPRTRSSTERCGWCSASSAVILPVLTRCWTKEWSLVTWVSSPSRSRYARESPMCAIASLLPARSSAVTVVPRPASSGFSSARASSSACASPSARLELVQRVVRAVRLVVQRGQVCHGDRGRDVTARVPAHPVGDDQQVGPGVGRVLVVRPHESHVGPGGVAQRDRHRLTRFTAGAPASTGRRAAGSPDPRRSAR